MRQSNESTTACRDAPFWPAIVVLALAGGPLLGGERPSQIWSPHPSEPWPSRSASLPDTSVEPLPLPTPDPSQAEEPVFEAPPLEEATCPAAGAAFAEPPRYVGRPHPDAWRVQSHFLPSLGRFGLVAPHAPGVESVHSPYLMGPIPWAAPVYGESLFPAPPLPGGLAPHAAAPTGAAHHDGPADQTHDQPGHAPPVTDPRAHPAPFSSEDFTADPFYGHLPYDAWGELDVYGGKYLNPVQRPLIEWGMPFYDTGPVPPPSERCGVTNPSLPRFYVYGDYRAAMAYNAQGGRDKGVLANRLNLEWDLWITATERIHMFTGPMQRGNNFMRLEFDGGEAEFFDELEFFNPQTDTLFFEGDLGYMVGGWTGQYAPFDMPIAAGLIPLLFQNGIWMEDAIVGVAATIPARHNRWLDWSNYDVTFFAGFDQVTSPAFAASNSAANVFGAITFIEAKGGYIEAGYAFLDDTTDSRRSYHNVGLSYTRRYLNLLSNSMRVIVNAGQGGPADRRTADGILLIAENSFLTPWPYNVIPYVNLWVGFDSPQSVARAGAAGGVLRNTGILFESDNLTGFPTLDATANDTYGAALGLNLLAPGFTHQLILEASLVQAFGDDASRNAAGDQYGLGLRYQVPISHAHLLRFDVMHGWLSGADDVTGARAEFRWKF